MSKPESKHAAFVELARRTFATTTGEPEVAYGVTYESWFAWLRDQVRAAIWPGALVTCRRCQLLGCDLCAGTGRVELGASNEEEERMEVAVRLLINARYFCPPERLPWMDIAINTYCSKWADVVRENTPQF